MCFLPLKMQFGHRAQETQNFKVYVLDILNGIRASTPGHLPLAIAARHPPPPNQKILFMTWGMSGGLAILNIYLWTPKCFVNSYEKPFVQCSMTIIYMLQNICRH